MLLLLLIASPVQDKLEAARRVLRDRSYSNYWDRMETTRDLARLDSIPAAELLCTLLDDSEAPLREAAVLGLARMRSGDVRRRLHDLSGRLGEDERRANLLWAFRRGADPEAPAAAIRGLADRAPRVREEAARFLARVPSPEAADALARALSDPRAEVREQVVRAYARCRGEGARLEALRNDPSPRVRAAVLLHTADVGALEAAARDAAVEPRIAALESAGERGPDAVVRVAAPLLDDREWPVRAAALAVLEECWDKRAVGMLIARLPLEDGRLRLDIVTALERMTGKAIGFDARSWTAWWEANREGFSMPGKGRRVVPQGETRASFMNLPLLSRRIVFVIDFSGSMKSEDEVQKGRRKIDVAFEELEKALSGLTDEARVNVIALSTEATARKRRRLLPAPAAMTPANRRCVLDALRAAWRSLETVERGRGDIYDAVVEAFDEGDTVILLSDGKPTYGTYLDREHIEEALTEIHRYRRVTVHTVLTGRKGTDPATMQAISRATRGLFRAER